MKNWNIPVYLKVNKADGKVWSCSTDMGLIERSLSDQFEMKVEQWNPKETYDGIMNCLTLVERMFMLKSWYAIAPEEFTE